MRSTFSNFIEEFGAATMKNEVDNSFNSVEDEQIQEVKEDLHARINLI